MPCRVSLSVCRSASLVLTLNSCLFHFRCWLSSDFPQLQLVYYITTVTIPSSVVLSNGCLLVLVVFKLRSLRREGGSSWRNMCKDKGSQLVKDLTTVLGLSCVLGLTWGFTSITYVSMPGIYIFTVLNSLQGQSMSTHPLWLLSHLLKWFNNMFGLFLLYPGLFMFLWSVALIFRSRSENSSLRDTSSLKITMTNFNSNNEK